MRHAFFSLFKDVTYPPDLMKCYLERFTVQINLYPKSPLIHSALEGVPCVLQESVISVFCVFKREFVSLNASSLSHLCMCVKVSGLVRYPIVNPVTKSISFN